MGSGGLDLVKREEMAAYMLVEIGAILGSQYSEECHPF